MNKLVRTGAIALSFALVVGSASAAKWNWAKNEGGALDVPSNWSKDGGSPTAINPEDEFRISGASNNGTNVISGDLTLSGDFNVTRLDFGYSTYAVEGVLNLGVGNSVVCGDFDVIDGAVGKLVSGTIKATGGSRIGKCNGGVGNRMAKFVIDGPDAGLIVEKGYLAVGFGNKTNSCLEVLNGANVSLQSPVLVGHDGYAERNTLLVSGKGTKLTTTDVVEIGANWRSADNKVIVTDGAKLTCSKVYIGSASNDEGISATGNVFVLANGADFEMTGDALHLGRNAAVGNMLMVSNAVINLSKVELYHPEAYSNATVCVAGTNTCLVLDDRDNRFYRSQTLIFDISGPQVQEQMIECKQTVFEEGSKLYITSSKDLTKVDSFEVVAIANRYENKLSAIPDGVLEIDPECGLEVDVTTDPTKLIIRHTKKAQVLGTHVFFH